MRVFENTEVFMPVSRRFGLADAMILIAATAAALACLRSPLEHRMTFHGDGRLIYNVRPFTVIAASFASMWTLGTLAILLRNRPSLERRRSPGFIACVAAIFGAIFKLTALLLWGIAMRFRIESWYVPTVLGQLIDPAAISVGVAWMTLLLTGVWRRGRQWADNLGISIGLLWIILDVLAWAALCLE
jgi:hypothetical protein